MAKKTWAKHSRSEAPTREPVTLSGWYECTDGTYCEVLVRGGHVIERHRLASVDEITAHREDMRAARADEERDHERRQRAMAQMHAARR